MDAAYVAGKDSRMKYFGGCDAGSTYTKCVIIDENGNTLYGEREELSEED